MLAYAWFQRYSCVNRSLHSLVCLFNQEKKQRRRQKLTPVNRFQYITTHPTLWMFLDARYDNSFITRRSFFLDNSTFSNMSPNPRARGPEKYYTLSKSNSNMSTIPIPVCCHYSYRRQGHQHPKAISVKTVLLLTEYTGKRLPVNSF